MFPHMRTPAVVVVLLASLGACSDTAAPHGANLQSLSSSYAGACGRNETQLRCWGSQGILTNGYSATTPVQPAPPMNGLEVVSASPFGEHGCGITPGGQLYCWGYGNPYGYGQAAYTAVAPTLRFTDVTVGEAAQCALAVSGIVYCWGPSPYVGVAEDSPAIQECVTQWYSYACVPEPTPVASTERFTAVSAGSYHTCALAQSGQVYCWGGGSVGAGPDVDASLVPIAVESTDRFTSLASGSDGTCAISNGGQPLCWGYDYGGMLGPGTVPGGYLAQPTPVPLPDGVVMQSISLGASHSCAIDSQGAAWCWGTGGLGSGTTSSSSPMQVLGGLTFSTLAAGDSFTCGISGNGAWCWGSNGSGQLGNGGEQPSPIPVRVAGQDQFDD